MKKLTLTVAVTAVVGLLALASPALAQTPVTSFAPSTNTAFGVWFESDVSGNSIRRFDQSGAFIDVFVSAGAGGLDDPTGVTFGPDGNLYVSGIVNNAVLRYNGTTGAFIDVFTSGFGLLAPEIGLV